MTSLRFLEHGKHAPCHKEATKDIDPGHKDRQSGQDNHQKRTRSDLHQRAQNNDRRNGVGDRHQWRVQRMRHVPNHLEPDENRQNKHDKVLHETGWSIGPANKHQTTTNGQQGHLVTCLLS